MTAVFTNSKNSKTSDPYRLLVNLTFEINLKKSDKYVALSNISIYYTWKKLKSSYKKKKKSSSVEQAIPIKWWIMFFIRYSRLF